MIRKISKRKRGGVSRSLDYIHFCLTKRSRGRSFPKAVALLEVANLLHIVMGQAQRGDKECGYFLGELLPILWKTRLGLEKANETFRQCFSKIQSARLPTAKESRLRRLTYRLIINAKHERRRLQMAKHMRMASLVIKPNEQLLALPNLDSSPEAIDAWTNVVVYPRLRKMARKLSSDPVIGKLKKALDENGKFQISRLKPLVRATVGRIAALPQRYYFDIA